MHEWLTSISHRLRNRDSKPISENTEDVSEFQRFCYLVENSEARMQSDSQTRREQELMFLIGTALSIKREETAGLTIAQAAQSIGVSTYDMMYAELGIIEPDKFFSVMNRWSGLLGIDPKTLMSKAAELLDQNIT